MILPFGGRLPRIAASAFVAPTATIIGDVTIGDDSSVWFGAVLRGDTGRIEIGARTSVQDNAVVHTSEHLPTVIGDDVTVGHGAVLEGCTIERGALVGMNAVVLYEAVVGAESLVAAGSVVTDGTKIPPRSVAAGAPCKVRKPLEGVAAQWIARAGPAYVRLSRRYLHEHAGAPAARPDSAGQKGRAAEGPVPG
ncbi:MAG TPA: gamma carbonic anhydrase family protein [bacterium]|nr:gamma carbonic anhydrase family protein [bacterium]